MRIGLATVYSLRPGYSWDEAWDHLVWTCKWGDDHGFVNYWLTEHHFTEYGATDSPSVVLAYLAAVTKQIRVGYGVALLPFHHPIRLAEEMLLVDRMSRGRLDIGIGRGHAPLETAVLCPDNDRSTELFDDAFAILRHAFAGEAFAFQGKYWTFPEVKLYPPPVQQNPPFYLVMTSPRTIAFAASVGAVPVLGSRPTAFLEGQLKEYIDAAHAADLPEDRLQAALDRVSCSRYLALADSREQAREQAAAELAHYSYAHGVYQKPVGDPTFHRDVVPVPPIDLPEDALGTSSIWGTRDDVIDQIRDLERAGIRQISISVDAPTTSPEEGRRRLERFTREVLPHIQPVGVDRQR